MRSRSRLRSAFRWSSAALALAAVATAPLLVGAVHRPVTLAVAAVVLLGLALAIAGGSFRRDTGALTFWLALPLATMTALTLLQLVPIPTSMRHWLDPNGLELLSNGPAAVPSVWSLSLAPRATWQELARAAATLACFLAASRCTADRRFGGLAFVRAIAIVGAIAGASGIVHRFLGAETLFGLFPLGSAVVPGPFINPNHSAELYELAAFCAFAVLSGSTTPEAKLAWGAIALFDAGTAVCTLSRGSLLALGAGLVVLAGLRRRWVTDGDARDGVPAWRRGIAGVLVAGVLVTAAAVALGAAPIIEEVLNTDPSSPWEKPAVWRDSLPIVLKHPLGLGRGAFDLVYPAYQNLSRTAHWAFVENAPLQLLLDFGVLGFLAAVGAIAGAVVMLRRLGRRDAIEAALIAGLAALAMHNLVDFGIETLGIRLAAAAIWGSIAGRQRLGDQEQPHARAVGGVAWGTAAVLGFGLVALVFPTNRELDESMRAATNAQERRTRAIDAASVYPTDYFFPLFQSTAEPLIDGPRRDHSPRLTALNRSLRLCPKCPEPHVEAARALWLLGRRSQAVAEWQQVIRLDDRKLWPTFDELRAHGAASPQLASLAVGDAEQTLALANRMAELKQSREVGALLELARARGASGVDLALGQARLQLELGDLAGARSTLTHRPEWADDARVQFALSEVERKRGDLPAAFAAVTRAAALDPANLTYAAWRIETLLQLQRWDDVQTAVEAYKAALRHNGQNVADAHVASGRGHQMRGNLPRALHEYRTAAALAPDRSELWRAVAQTAEALGDVTSAIEAYRTLTRLSPKDEPARASLQRLEQARASARLREALTP